MQLPSPVAARSAEERLRLLLRVSQLLAAPADAESIATRILDLAFQLLEADRGAVLLFDPRTHALTPVAVRNEAADPGVTGETPYSRRIIDWVRTQRAAVGMQRVLATLSLPVPLQIHVALHTGPVAAGNIGTPEFIQYATIGEATNLAARVCGVAGAGEVVVSETTLRALTPGADAWKTTPLGPVVLKGRAEPLRLYRVEWPLE